MKRIAGAGLVLLLAVLLPTNASAQSEGERGKFRLGPSHPDPVSQVVRIPFELDDALFEGDRLVFVTLRVKDLLGRPVAVPHAADHPAGDAAVEGLEYDSPGPKEALWDGTDRAGRRLPPATYLLELVVNGERAPPVRFVVPD